MSTDTTNLLILGAGWTSTFLIPLLKRKSISYVATTRSGDNNTLPFTFDPDSSDPTPFTILPKAKTVLITFPIRIPSATKRLVELYNSTHTGGEEPGFIQLGSTGVWAAEGISDRHTPIDFSNARGLAEEELLELGGAVLNLAGLWGGERMPKNWLSRVAKTKEELKKKGGLHLVHGEDVAQGVVTVHEQWSKAKGQRWALTDLRCYDWWNLAMSWGGEEEKEWVGELMNEEGIRVLPRETAALGRSLDSSEFWRTFGVWPGKSLIG